MSFVVCSQCRRHHRSQEASCPFCARRGARAWTVAAAAVALAACQADAPAREPAAPPVVAEEAEEQAQTPAEEDAPTPVVEVAPSEEPSEPSEDDAEPEELAPDESEEKVAADKVKVTPQPIEEPKFDRPMVARYGIAPRPMPPKKPTPPKY